MSKPTLQDRRRAMLREQYARQCEQRDELLLKLTRVVNRLIATRRALARYEKVKAKAYMVKIQPPPFDDDPIVEMIGPGGG